jgi:hypothetical protein
MKAIVTRGFRHDGQPYLKGQQIDLPDGQFEDWRDARLVKAAPAEQPSAAAPADAPPPKP